MTRSPSGKRLRKRSIRVSTSVSPEIVALIDELLDTGLFGFTRAQLVRELLYRQLREHIRLPQTVREVQQRIERGRG